jgi:hypothetical protein
MALLVPAGAVGTQPSLRTPLGISSHHEKSGIPLLMSAGVLDRRTYWEDVRPGDPLSRAELAVLFARLIRYAEERSIALGGKATRSPSFLDLKDTHWAAPAVAEVTRRGVLLSSSDHYHPHDQVTKLELFRWVYRLLAPRFADSASDANANGGLLGDDWAAVQAVVHGWRVSYLVHPQNGDLESRCTRAFAAQTLAQVVRLIDRHGNGAGASRESPMQPGGATDPHALREARELLRAVPTLYVLPPDQAERARLLEPLKVLSKYNTPVLRKAVELELKETKPEEIMALWRRIYLLNRYVFAVPAGIRRDVVSFSGFIGPWVAGGYNALWPLGENKKGELVIVSPFGRYMGPGFHALKEFDYFHRKFGRRRTAVLSWAAKWRL